MSTTQSSGASAPPLLPETEKFDCTNYPEWRETILIACRVRGARGYLDGTILKPTQTTASAATTTTTTTDSPTPRPGPMTAPADTKWTSTTPSHEEWDTRDVWCTIFIL